MLSNKSNKDKTSQNNEIMKRMENTIQEMNRFKNEYEGNQSNRNEHKNTNYDKSPGRIYNKETNLQDKSPVRMYNK